MKTILCCSLAAVTALLFSGCSAGGQASGGGSIGGAGAASGNSSMSGSVSAAH